MQYQPAILANLPLSNAGTEKLLAADLRRGTQINTRVSENVALVNHTS
jgi:hypothetical protein